MTTRTMDAVLADLLAQRSWVESLCRTLVRNPADADDVAQATWLSALRHGDPLRRPRAWLAKVAGNHARMQRRADARRRARDTAAGTAANEVAPSAAEVQAAFEVQQTVARAVHALAEPFRTTVLLHHFEGLTLAAIARQQNEPEGTVRWRLHRAHELLRERLQGHYGDDWRTALAPLCGAALRRGAGSLFAAVAMLAIGCTVAWYAATAWRAEPEPTPLASASAPTLAPDAPTADQRGGERAPVATATAAEPTDRTAPSPAAADQRAVVRARIVGADGAPLPGATLRFAGMRASGVFLQSPLQSLLLHKAIADQDGRAALVLHTDARLLQDLPASMRPAPGDPWHLALEAAAAQHCIESLDARVADGDDLDLGTIRMAPATALRGRVVDTEGEPVAGARVGVFAPPLPVWRLREPGFDLADARATATTGSLLGRGRYTIDLAPRGPLLLVATAEGFSPAHGFCRADGDRLQAEDLVLTRLPKDEEAPPPQQVLVVDAAGTPVADAPLYCRHPHGSAMTRTDQAGRARFAATRNDGRWDRSPRSYCAVDPSGRRAAAFLDDVPFPSDEVTLRLAAGRLVEVAVVQPAGTGDVLARWQPTQGPGEGWLRPDADGHLRFAAPPREAVLEITAEGCSPFVSPRYAAGDWPARLDVELRARPVIRGRVLTAGVPVEGAAVRVLVATDGVLVDGFRRAEFAEAGRAVTTAADGTFALPHDTPGTLCLLVGAKGLARTVTAPHAFDPKAGWQPAPIELEPGGGLRGRVRTADGRSVPRAVIAAHHPLCGTATTTTDRDGAFAFADLAEGSYELRLVTAEETGATVSLAAAQRAHPAPADALVRRGAVTHCDVVLDACELAIEVAGPAGLDFAGWRASLHARHDGATMHAETPVDAAGTVVLRSARSGSHELRLQAPGGSFGTVQVHCAVELVAGRREQRIDLDLRPWRGTVPWLVDTAAGTWVRLVQVRGDLQITAGATSAAGGGLEAALAPRGDVTVYVGNRALGTATIQ